MDPLSHISQCSFMCHLRGVVEVSWDSKSMEKWGTRAAQSEHSTTLSYLLVFFFPKTSVFFFLIASGIEWKPIFCYWAMRVLLMLMPWATVPDIGTKSVYKRRALTIRNSPQNDPHSRWEKPGS